MVRGNVISYNPCYAATFSRNGYRPDLYQDAFGIPLIMRSGAKTPSTSTSCIRYLTWSQSVRFEPSNYQLRIKGGLPASMRWNPQPLGYSTNIMLKYLAYRRHYWPTGCLGSLLKVLLESALPKAEKLARMMFLPWLVGPAAEPEMTVNAAFVIS